MGAAVVCSYVQREVIKW